MGASEQFCRVLGVTHGENGVLFGVLPGKARRKKGFHVVIDMVQQLLPGALPLMGIQNPGRGDVQPLGIVIAAHGFTSLQIVLRSIHLIHRLAVVPLPLKGKAF